LTPVPLPTSVSTNNANLVNYPDQTSGAGYITSPSGTIYGLPIDGNVAVTVDG